jgi:hypothetical protein
VRRTLRRAGKSDSLDTYTASESDYRSFRNYTRGETVHGTLNVLYELRGNVITSSRFLFTFVHFFFFPDHRTPYTRNGGQPTRSDTGQATRHIGPVSDPIRLEPANRKKNKTVCIIDSACIYPFRPFPTYLLVGYFGFETNLIVFLPISRNESDQKRVRCSRSGDIVEAFACPTDRSRTVFDRGARRTFADNTIGFCRTFERN